MSYRKINFLLFVLFVAVFVVNQTRAQGLVSLSEEAMFDDGLETLPEKPANEISITQDAPSENIEIPAPSVVSNAPTSAPKAPIEEKAILIENNYPVSSDENQDSLDIFNSTNNDDIADQDLFTQMSDLEKRTALLNLELRREKLQNEIEAVKNQRRQALQQEQDKIEQQKLKNMEFEKEQERKVLVEQQKLRELDINFENLRQEKILNAYKNQMLEENQKWIANNANFYKQIADLKDSKKAMAQDLKDKLTTLQNEAKLAKDAHNNKIRAYKKEIDDLQTQISVLRDRLDAVEKENMEMKQNPFASPEAMALADKATQKDSDKKESGDVFEGEPEETDLSNMYAAGSEYTPTGNIVTKTLYAIWAPRTDMPYKVYHYTEKLGMPNEYELRLLENCTGTTGQDVFVLPKTSGEFKGFTENTEHDDRLVMTELLGDGSTELRIYYKRKNFTLSFIAENGRTLDTMYEVPYESEIQLSIIPNNGYEFDKKSIQLHII